MPSTRITIHGSSPERVQSKVTVDVNKPRDPASNVSQAAELLIDTIHFIRFAKVSVPRTFLLTGPPGVGKTYSVRLAMEASRKRGPTQLVSLQGSELLSASSHPAEAAKCLNRQFQSLARFCRNESHAGILFIDECEALLSSDSVAAMFSNLLDKVSCSPDNGWQRIVIVAATNRIDAVPAWLRRPGRLDREIALGPPDAWTRLQIIKSLLSKAAIRFSEDSGQVGDEDLSVVAEACVGYVPADLAALVRRASLLALQEDSQQIKARLLKRAMADVGASVSRYGVDPVVCY